MKATAAKSNDPSADSPSYEDVFMNIPAPTAIISGLMKVVAVNTAFKTFFRLSDDDLQMPVSLDAITSSFWMKQDVQQQLQLITESKEEQAETTFDWQHEDGSLKYVRLQSQRLPAGSSFVMLTFCDVTEAKLMEKKHSESIRHMMHELRNPLSNISLCVELLADSTKENNQEDTDMFLSKASTSVQRMKQLISDLSPARKAS